MFEWCIESRGNTIPKLTARLICPRETRSSEWSFFSHSRPSDPLSAQKTSLSGKKCFSALLLHYIISIRISSSSHLQQRAESKMPMMETNMIVLDSLVIFSSIIGILSSFSMMIFIVYHITKRKNSPNRVPLFLTSNMYLSIFFFCTCILDIHGRSLSKRLYASPSVHDDLFCRIRAHLTSIAGGGMFYSNMLQALFRLCRVIFYTRRNLQQFSLYRIMIIIQWLLCGLFVMPNILLGDYEYFEDGLQCQISLLNRRSAIFNFLVLYFIPVIVTIGSYMYTVRKARTANTHLRQPMTQIQIIAAQRDMVVLFRICILIVPMLMFSVPTVIVFVAYLTEGRKLWWSIQVQWLVFVISMTFVNVILALISPHVRNLFPGYCRRPRRIQATTISLVQGRLDQSLWKKLSYVHLAQKHRWFAREMDFRMKPKDRIILFSRLFDWLMIFWWKRGGVVFIHAKNAVIQPSFVLS